jgi:hypothetical protein
MPTEKLSAAEQFISDALRIVGTHNEQSVRDNLTSHLRLIFPDNEWWVQEHISVCEKGLKYSTAARDKQGFVDNLIGCTAIEYEANLTKPAVRAHGLEQIREYCAGLLQEKIPQDLIVGVLSDTLRWEAYEVASFAWSASADGKSTVDASSVVLHEIGKLEVKTSDTANARQLIRFLRTHVGRQGSRRLAAETIAADLGLDSKFCESSHELILSVVSAQLKARPDYAEVLRGLWRKFVGFVSGSKNPVEFDQTSYAAELYVLTLAKLVLANVLNGKALASDDDELRAILNGEFFEQLHLKNLVEYDYFGWLNEAGAIEPLLPIARKMQADVSAYDFRSPPAEDLFGRLLLQLPSAKQRILLGQQWTPGWLAEKVVHWVLTHLPPGADPLLLDMCCGSGTMVAEALKQRKKALPAGLTPQERYERLRSTIAGFDIDPLAVMLAKASWLLAVRDVLQPLTEVESIVIPVYNADSLMRVTGVSDSIDAGLKKGSVRLEFADKSVSLPAFLVAPDLQRQFDLLLDRAYPFAIELAKARELPSSADIEDILDGSELTVSHGLEPKRVALVHKFATELVGAIRQLQIERRNGIWGFILKNSYRPALVAGQFNGLISNPPWMALSRLADNPYAEFLREKARELAVLPAGSSAPHTELATVFLLHAVERFLSDGAAYACIVPETTLNGSHQENFRKGRFLSSKRPVPMAIDEIWRVDEAAFDTNKSVVLCGHRAAGAEAPDGAIPGIRTSPAVDTPVVFQVVNAARHLIWTERESDYLPEGHPDSRFQQGADVFPRRLWFHEVVPSAKGTYRVSRIEKNSAFRYLVSDEKKAEVQSFRVPQKSIRARNFQDVLISKHLVPFHVAAPGLALLPLKRAGSGAWVALKPTEIARDPNLLAVMRSCLKKFKTAQGLPATSEAVLSYVTSARDKLQHQQFSASDTLIVYGAGGSDLCAGLVRGPSPNLIVDQTLYWAKMPSESEALYLLGMLNSPQVNKAITPFQAAGLQTERHIHKLPFLFIPPFAKGNAAHRAVVTTTKRLLVEFNASSNSIADALFPQSALTARRRVVRRYLETLAGYAAYVGACDAVISRRSK